MDIALVNKQTNICENIAVFEDIQTAITIFGEEYIAVEVESGYGIGDTYEDGIWTKAQQLQDQTKTADNANKKGLNISQKIAHFLLNH